MFLGKFYLAATSLLLSPFFRSWSAWHFSRNVLWVYFCLPATTILRTNNTATWRKSKQKNTHQYLASLKALKHSNISTFDSSIRKLEHFNTWIQCIRTLVTTYIMKALWIKNGTMAVHLRRKFIDRRRFINTFGQGIRLKTHLKGYHDEVDSQKWRNSQSSTRIRERVWQIRSRSWKMWWCGWTSF